MRGVAPGLYPYVVRARRKLVAEAAEVLSAAFEVEVKRQDAAAALNRATAPGPRVRPETKGHAATTPRADE